MTRIWLVRGDDAPFWKTSRFNYENEIPLENRREFLRGTNSFRTVIFPLVISTFLSWESLLLYRPAVIRLQRKMPEESARLRKSRSIRWPFENIPEHAK